MTRYERLLYKSELEKLQEQLRLHEYHVAYLVAQRTLEEYFNETLPLSPCPLTPGCSALLLVFPDQPDARQTEGA